MKNGDFEKGKIKVVWIKSDPLRIYSKMFENIKAAVEFGEKKEDYIIFSLVQQKDMQEFEWKLLRYGKYKLYTALVQSYMKTKPKNVPLPRAIKRFLFS